MILIGIGGAAGAGKDMVGSILADYGYRRFAFADALRDEVAHAIASSDYPIPPWLSPLAVEAFCFATVEEVYAKPTTPRMRALLREWGMYRRSQNAAYWVDQVREKLIGVERAVLTDMRMENEAGLVKEFGGYKWLVRRPGYELGGHVTELAPFTPDLIIDNSGDKGHLLRQVNRALVIQEHRP